MKTAFKTGKIVALILVAVMLVFMLCACSSASIQDKLVGTWVVADEDALDNSHLEKTYTFYSDGKGSSNPWSFTWHYSEDTKELELTWLNLGGKKYPISLSGDTLYLDGVEYHRAS